MRAFLAGRISCLLGGLVLAFPNGSQVSFAAPPATTQTSQPSDKEVQKRKDIAELEAYYADLYAKPIAEKNRLSQLIAVMSLSRINADPLTKKLFGAMHQPDVLVGQLAWEALHTRQASLDAEERGVWLSGGMDVARRGGFPGVTIAPLLEAISEQQASSIKGLPELLFRVAEENDPATESGKRALDAARASVVKWSDLKFTRMLIGGIAAKPKSATRIAYLLQSLPDAPPASDDANAVRTAWLAYARDAKMVTPTTLPAYAGVGKVFNKPDVIEDPRAKKWRKELELPKLSIDSVEIAFCIDATGSMEASNDYVTAYVEVITRLMRVMSDQVKAGAVYYRHEIDPAIMVDCCRTIAKRPSDFRVKFFPLTPEPKALVTQMRNMKQTGKFSGHGGDGAYAAGIATAMNALQWAPKSKRIIACTGDANITPGSDKAMIELAKKAKDTGFLLMFVVRDARASRSVEASSQAATGQDPILYKPDIEKLASADAKNATEAAIDKFKGTAFESMTVRVIELSLPADYRDRAKPLIAAVLPIFQAQEAAANARATVK